MYEHLTDILRLNMDFCDVMTWPPAKPFSKAFGHCFAGGSQQLLELTKEGGGESEEEERNRIQGKEGRQKETVNRVSERSQWKKNKKSGEPEKIRFMLYLLCEKNIGNESSQWIKCSDKVHRPIIRSSAFYSASGKRKSAKSRKYESELGPKFVQWFVVLDWWSWPRPPPRRPPARSRSRPRVGRREVGRKAGTIPPRCGPVSRAPGSSCPPRSSTSWPSSTSSCPKVSTLRCFLWLYHFRHFLVLGFFLHFNLRIFFCNCMNLILLKLVNKKRKNSLV